MADMIVLFMALAFCIQAGFLVAFASHYGKVYVTAMRTTLDSLIGRCMLPSHLSSLFCFLPNPHSYLHPYIYIHLR